MQALDLLIRDEKTDDTTSCKRIVQYINRNHFLIRMLASGSCDEFVKACLGAAGFEKVRQERSFLTSTSSVAPSTFNAITCLSAVSRNMVAEWKI